MQNVSYSFGFSESERFFEQIPPGRTTGYHRFATADRCSGWRLKGSFTDSTAFHFGPALCAVAEPLAPGKYSLVVQRLTAVENGVARTVVRTKIVED